MSDFRQTMTQEYLNYIARLSDRVTVLNDIGNSVVSNGGASHIVPPPPPPLHDLVAQVSHMRADLRGLIELASEMRAQGLLRGVP